VGDGDPAGIVFYPRYLVLFAAGTAALFERALALDGRAMRKAHGCLGFPMVDTRARFLVPSRYGDAVTVTTQVTACRTSSFDVHHRLLKGSSGKAMAAREEMTRRHDY
jgi:4-hydroxybenzoyl-CoA thioesterase